MRHEVLVFQYGYCCASYGLLAITGVQDVRQTVRGAFCWAKVSANTRRTM